jgi:glycosyltransferase involved in cell wall biosynthesis
MISIVTGTLNRLNYLPQLIENTVGSNDKLELVLVDGGSIDGTIDYINKLNNPRIRLVEVGKRSYYWHYMNIGIENSSHEWICQWNDDLLLEDKWEDVINEIEKDPHDFYPFSWREPGGNYVIYDNAREFVVNYGLYNKKIFREIGMYNPSYKYYCCDGDMSFRARELGYSYKNLFNIRCFPMTTRPEEKKALWENYEAEMDNYFKTLDLYRKKEIPTNIPKLK